jgi:hypothetical protein
MKKSVWPILLVGLGLIAFLSVKMFHRKETIKPMVENLLNDTNAVQFKQIRTNKPASRLTPAERKTLEELFAERFKPAIDKWANAYKGHIPFDVSEINLSNFYAVSAGCYTFMIGSTTFVIYNSKDKAKVFYLMTKQGAHDFNSIPTDGKPRDLSVPITKEEVLPMAEADTGLHYELKDIVIRPTGAYCVIDGGADVEVGIKHENGMEIAAIDNLSFTLGKDGKFITYQH